MKSKIFLPVLIGLVLMAAAVITATTGLGSRKQKTTPEKSLATETLDIDGSVKAYAREAKARGLQRIVIPAPSMTYDGAMAGLDEAMLDHSVVVAQPIESRSLITGSDLISTWYKFRITDTLSKKKPSPSKCKECAPPAPPDEMLPLKKDEILIPRVGGMVIVEGVEVTMLSPQSPEYKMNQDYLLLLSETTPQVSNVRAGSLGALLVKADGTLQSIDKESNPIHEDLKSRFKNSVHELKAHLKQEDAPDK